LSGRKAKHPLIELMAAPLFTQIDLASYGAASCAYMAFILKLIFVKCQAKIQEFMVTTNDFPCYKLKDQEISRRMK
jgi:hypothetical protein